MFLYNDNLTACYTNSLTDFPYQHEMGCNTPLISNNIKIKQTVKASHIRITSKGTFTCYEVSILHENASFKPASKLQPFSIAIKNECFPSKKPKLWIITSHNIL